MSEADELESALLTWANCATPNCENKECRWAGTGHCHPCSVRILGAGEMDRRLHATRNPDGSWNGAVAEAPDAR